MAPNAGEWMPRAQWDALARGEGCPLCVEVAGAPDAHTIADLAVSRLRLAENQWIAGYCVLVCTIHVREPYELPRDDCARFFADLMRSAQAIERALQPIKMNYEILGNAVPHLHAHLVPRYYGDPAPGMPITVGEQDLRLAPAEAAQRAQLIRAAL